MVLLICSFVKTAISFTQPIQRDKAPSTSYQYLWGTKVIYFLAWLIVTSVSLIITLVGLGLEANERLFLLYRKKYHNMAKLVAKIK